ncbi:MAG: hypothetical protein GF344_16255 [Chitinivibrionales bacterium]|nr:hypothetical protein [Chitinivibrionales bacterium]MBD3358249.1 hypothetical protein [Chitinivibrionales bacterium]
MSNNMREEAAPPTRVWGITVHGGEYYLAGLGRSDGRWQLLEATRWPVGNLVRHVFLFDRGLILGLPVVWRPAHSLVPAGPTIDATPTDFFTCSANRTELTNHVGRLDENILGVTHDDIFLATVPLFFADNPVDSFVSIYCHEQYFLIGVVHRRTLMVSYRMHPPKPDWLAGHLGRIERHWQINADLPEFPSAVYVFGNDENLQRGVFAGSPEIVQVDPDVNDSEPYLRAVGCALAQATEGGTYLAGESHCAKFRHKRALLYYGAAIITVLTFLASLAIGFWDAQDRQRLETVRAEYHRTIAEAPEAQKQRALLTELAGSIHRLGRITGKRFQWSHFLEAVAAECPGGMGFVSMGTRIDDDSPDRVVVALAGWANEERFVNEFVVRLRARKFISDARHVSLRRDPKNPEIFEFQIQCHLLKNIK